MSAASLRFVEQGGGGIGELGEQLREPLGRGALGALRVSRWNHVALPDLETLQKPVRRRDGRAAMSALCGRSRELGTEIGFGA